MGTLTVITEPTLEPVTLQEAKDALRIDHPDEDLRILGLIKAARQWVEDFCNIRIMNQTIELSFDYFPAITFALGTWPLQSVASVKYDDTSSPVTEQTLVDNTDYHADTTTVRGRLTAISGWPSSANQPNSVRIRMTAGYTGTEVNTDNVPDIIKQGVEAYLNYLYYLDDDMRKAAISMLRLERLL